MSISTIPFSALSPGTASVQPQASRQHAGVPLAPLPAYRSVYPRFGNLPEPVQSDIRAAWQRPEVKKAIEQVVLTDLFKDCPEAGRTFLKAIQRHVASNAPVETVYANLRQAFLTLPQQGKISQSFQRHRDERVDARSRQVLGLINDMPKPDMLLDVGYGDGRITQNIAKGLNLAKAQVTGAEIFEPEEPPTYMDCVLIEEEDFPLPNASQDLTILISVLHHVEDPRELLESVYRVTSKGGRVLIREFDCNSQDVKIFNLVMDHLFYRVFSDEPQMPNPGHFYDSKTWFTMFQKAGFILDKVVQPEPPEVNPYHPFTVVLRKP